MKKRKIRGINAPSLAPQSLGDSDWFYEGDYKIILVHEVKDISGNYLKTDQVKIPWKKLIASAKRCQPQHFK